MRDLEIRSPHEKVSGLVHFGRMLDKLRLHAQGRLPSDYVGRLGRGLDGRLSKFLEVNYAELRDAVVNRGLSDEAALEWCYQRGRRPSEELLRYFCAWLSKLGWRDEATELFELQLKAYGLSGHPEIQTIFDIIDADEGRLPLAARPAPTP
jgi:gluconokinase